jgi:ankyrin repeat protein
MTEHSSPITTVEPSTNRSAFSRLVTLALGLGAVSSIVALTVYFVRANRPASAVISFATVMTLLQLSILAVIVTLGNGRRNRQTPRSLTALLWVVGIGGAIYALLSGFQLVAVAWVACLVLVGLIWLGYAAKDPNASRLRAAALPACWGLMLAAAGVSWFSYGSMVATDRADRVAVQRELAKNAATRAMPENQLIQAVLAGDVERVDGLLEGGVNVSGDDDGRSPLTAAVKAERWEIATRLLEGGAKPRQADGPDLVYLALQKGRAELTRHLIQAGAADDIPPELGTRIAALAAASGEVEIVEMLLEKASHGVAGLLPYGGLFAQKSPQSGASPASIERFQRIVRCLFDRGMTPNRFQIHNLVVNTVRHGSAEFVEFVFGKLDRSQFEGSFSPLTLAVERGDKQILEIILSASDDPDERWRSRSTETALLHAVQADNPEFVQRLLDAGARPEGHPNGASPLKRAEQLNRKECIALIKSRIDRASAAGPATVNPSAF